jgi:hypothetical protein
LLLHGTPAVFTFTHRFVVHYFSAVFLTNQLLLQHTKFRQRLVPQQLVAEMNQTQSPAKASPTISAMTSPAACVQVAFHLLPFKCTLLLVLH